MKSKFAFLLLLSVLLHGWVPGQAPPLIPPPTAEARRVSFTAMGNFPTALYYQDEEGAFQTLPLGFEVNGPVLGILPVEDAQTPIRLYTREAAEDGQWIHPPAAEIHVPAEWTSALVLLQGGNGRVRSLPLNDSPEALAVGEVRFINYSDSRIAIVLGEVEALLNRGESHRYPLVQGGRTRLRLRILRNTGGEWVDYLSTSLSPRNPNIRLNMLTLMRPPPDANAHPVFETLHLRGNDLDIAPDGWLRP